MPLVSRATFLKIIFGTVSIVVMAAMAITYWFGVKTLHAHDEGLAHRRVIGRLDHVLSTLKDAETGQRGFIITGREEYLEPYRDALEVLRAEENALHENFAPLDPHKVDRINSLTTEKLKELKRTIELRRTEGFESSKAYIDTDAGRKTMGELRAVIGELVEGQKELLAEDERAADWMTTIRTVVFIAAGLITMGFIAWAFREIESAFHGQTLALAEIRLREQELANQKRLLEVTLTSIGDCVIVTDVESRITFMNTVAEEVTGWRAGEGLGKPTAEVFRIINEHSRETVEDPVAKVLKTGVIVGLANHTLLIRKDGTEVPIDDSGAPIRDGEGKVRGVVLVFRDFTEYKKSENALTEAKNTAEAASKAKDQFLAMLSHELRTPLTPVLAMLELWSASEELPSSMRQDVSMIQRNIELEARIIDDLLDLTKVARGLLNTTLEDTDVHEMITFVLGMCRSQFQGKELHVATQLEATLHFVHTDASRFQQIVWNVLRNALKFTETGGDVIIRTENDEAHHIKITISDTGIGMTPETIDKLFVPFDQGSQGIGKKYGGLGLGMSISRALADLLGGDIEAQSDGPGLGSSFTVTFPAFASPVRRPGSLVEPANRDGSLLQILLVEDHDDTAAALVRLLVRRGHSVRVAGSVAVALESVRKQMPELLLCDLGLPDGTGFDVIREMRKAGPTPAIALSGFGMEEDVARCRQAGFNDHLTKPVNFQKLEATMWQVMAHHG